MASTVILKLSLPYISPVYISINDSSEKTYIKISHK